MPSTAFQLDCRRGPSSVAVPRLAARALQRKCACGGTPGPSGECEECRKKRLSGTIQRAENSASNGARAGEAPSIVHDVLRSPGQPLDSATRSFMEPRFGHDFSAVRVHIDRRAGDSARAVNALAYTVGNHLVFAQGQYSPGSISGRKLVAHELAHNVQQSNAAEVGGNLHVAPSGDEAEIEADHAARNIQSSDDQLKMTSLKRFRSGRLQRQEGGESGESGPRPPPLIPIPIFDELDPMVIAPDVPGVPDFLRGQSIKLSDLRKAIDIFSGGGLPRPSTPGGDICAQLIPGSTMVRSGEFAGMCCPTMRTRESCCFPSRIGQLDLRCCTSEEVVISGRCVRPRRAPAQPTQPTQPSGPVTPGVTFPPPLPPFQIPGVRVRFGSITSDTIDHFVSGSAVVPASANERLNRLAGLLRLYRDAEVHIEGHTDTDDTAANNQTLSENRAEAIKRALISRGVNASQIIEIVGHGEEQLRFPEERTAEEKAGNRRVEIWYYTPPTESFSERFRSRSPILTPP